MSLVTHRMMEGRGMLMTSSTVVQVTSWWSCCSLLLATGCQVEATGWCRSSGRMSGDVLRVGEGGRDIGDQGDGQVATVVVVVQTRRCRCSSRRMVGRRCVGVGVVVMVMVVVGGCRMVGCSGSGCCMMVVVVQLRMQLRFIYMSKSLW